MVTLTLEVFFLARREPQSSKKIYKKDAQLANCGSTVRVDSYFAKDHDIIGAPIWRSPEAQLQIGWGTPQIFGPSAR